ncbi:MAG: DUF624 domain-containing protein [Clostridia bacterium]|nr:DUF624 domain-containing protein [Clostridia bacterium]
MAGFFGFFDYTKPGKGVSKDDVAKTGVSLYFDILGRRFWKLILLNLFYIIASIPAIIITWFISTYFVTWTASIAGLNIEENASALLLLGIVLSVIIFQGCGSGPATAAMNYVLRKYVNDTHSWVWADFVDNIKSNFRQGICVYVINTLVLCISTFGFVFYTYSVGGYLGVFFRTIVTLIIAVFLMMQMYTYQLMAGFELKVKDIYKNALLLTLIKLPQNILYAAVVAAIMYAVYSLSLSVPLAGILVVALLLFTLVSFTQIFMTNNIIKKYVLNPYLEQNPSEEQELPSPDFEDRISVDEI